MQATRKPRDGRTAPARIATMKRSGDPQRRQAALILEGFARSLRTEGAFYLRFCTLAPMQVEALRSFWGIEDNWRVFRRICRFFAI